MKVLFVVPYINLVPSSQVRVLQYLNRLKVLGIRCHVLSYDSPTAYRLRRLIRSGNPRLWTRLMRFVLLTMHMLGVLKRTYRWLSLLKIRLLSSHYDVVFFQWNAPPVPVTRALAFRTHLVYDFDDATFLVQPEEVDAIVRQAWRVLAGSHYNLEYAVSRNRHAYLVPSGVDVEDFRYCLTRVQEPRSAIRIGWIGSRSTAAYLELLVDPLSRLVKEGYQLELHLSGVSVSGLTFCLPAGVGVVETPVYGAKDIPELVRVLDIGVMPQHDTEWARGKCAMKALVYMAGRIPCVCSAVGEILHMVRNEEVLLADSPYQWYRQLKRLIDSPELRDRVGQAGFALVESTYSSDRCFAELCKAVFDPLMDSK